MREQTYEELKLKNEQLEARLKAEAKTIASLSEQLQERLEAEKLPPKEAPLAVLQKKEQGPQQRNLRTTATGPAAAARRQGVGGLSFLSDDMHNAILAACAAIVAEQNALCEEDRYSPTGQLLNPAPGIEYDVEDMAQNEA